MYAYGLFTGVGICVSTAHVHVCLSNCVYTYGMDCTRNCVALVCACAYTRVYLYVSVSSGIAVNACIRHCVCVGAYAQFPRVRIYVRTYVPRLVNVSKRLASTTRILCLLGDLGHDDTFNSLSEPPRASTSEPSVHPGT